MSHYVTLAVQLAICVKLDGIQREKVSVERVSRQRRASLSIAWIRSFGGGPSCGLRKGKRRRKRLLKFSDR